MKKFLPLILLVIPCTFFIYHQAFSGSKPLPESSAADSYKFESRTGGGGKSFRTKEEEREFVRELIDKEVVQVIRVAILEEEPNPEYEMFSRCPSGLYHYTFQEPDKDHEFYYGVVSYSVGCHGQPICFYRVNVQKEEIGISGIADEELDRLENAEAFSHSYQPAKSWLKKNAEFVKVRVNEEVKM